MGMYFDVEKSTRYTGEYCVNPTALVMKRLECHSVGEFYFKVMNPPSLKDLYKRLIMNGATIRCGRDRSNFYITFKTASAAESFVTELDRRVKSNLSE